MRRAVGWSNNAQRQNINGNKPDENSILFEPRHVSHATADLYMKVIQVSFDIGQKINVLGIPMVIRLHGRDTNGTVSAVPAQPWRGDICRSAKALKVEINKSMTSPREI